MTMKAHKTIQLRESNKLNIAFSKHTATGEQTNFNQQFVLGHTRFSHKAPNFQTFQNGISLTLNFVLRLCHLNCKRFKNKQISMR